MGKAIRKINHYYSVLGVPGVLYFLFAKLAGTRPLFKKALTGIRHPVYFRIGTTDLSVLRQVFVERQYDFRLPTSPKLIVDAGANIGLSAVFFANRYPSAAIVAIEPENSNLRVLKVNVAPYPQIKTMEAALWRENREISLFDSGQGNDSFQISEASEFDSSCKGRVTGVTVDAIMRRMGMDFIDLLKIDIEGAEKEVFENCSQWIDNVGVIMAELHDHLRAGCGRSFSEATKAFSAEFTRGETVMKQRMPGIALAPQITGEQEP
jgi:FkbM family methyltransferase